MRKYLLFSVTLLIALSVGFSSCESDDGDVREMTDSEFKGLLVGEWRRYAYFADRAWWSWGHDCERKILRTFNSDGTATRVRGFCDPPHPHDRGAITFYRWDVKRMGISVVNDGERIWQSRIVGLTIDPNKKNECDRILIRRSPHWDV
jgi:hypothetical protein